MALVPPPLIVCRPTCSVTSIPLALVRLVFVGHRLSVCAFPSCPEGIPSVAKEAPRLGRSCIASSHCRGDEIIRPYSQQVRQERELHLNGPRQQPQHDGKRQQRTNDDADDHCPTFLRMNSM